jgi:hypothetical protein
VISDAHEGIKAAVARVLRATWQRCQVHFMCNALAHAGRNGKRVVAAFIATAFAQDHAGAAQTQWRQVADQVRPKLPKLATLLEEAEQDVLAYMSFPEEHRAKIHSTNPLEGLNGEINRARQGTTGGEHKSDPRDAPVIAELVRIRHDLRPIETASELDLELRLLVGRRRDLIQGQTQLLSRLHDLLVGIFPGLERALNLTTKGPLVLLTKFVTPADLRAASKPRLIRHLKAAGGLPKIEALAERALAVAAEQTIAVPAERMTARLATEALATRSRLAGLDRELEDLLDHHPDAALIRSLPGMGPCSPPRQAASPASAPPTRWPPPPASPRSGASPARCASSGAPRAATRASSASSISPPSARWAIPTAVSSMTASDAREKRHHQAVLALARRRINVLRAMLNSRQRFQQNFKLAA